MKKLFTLKSTLVALLVMCCCAMRAGTVEYSTDDGFAYTLNTETQEASLVKYSGGANEVVIPEIVTYEGKDYKVTSLGEDCFLGKNSLTSVEIPSSVTKVGRHCFFECSSLTKIEIPASLTSWGEACIGSCSSLESIVVDAANPVYDSRESCNAIIETKSNTMLAGCKNTRIPQSVTSLGDWCFDRCSFTLIEIPSSVKRLGQGCFAGCESLETVICKMKNVVEGNGYYGIFQWTPIEDATLYVPEELFDAYQSTRPWNSFGTIRSLGVIFVEYATDDGFVYSLDPETQEASLTKYSGDAYEVIIPEYVTYEGKEYKVTSLWDNCFGDCQWLNSIVIPSSVTALGYGCFNGCYFLTSIEIPSSVTILGGFCFDRCWSLNTVICKMGNVIEDESIFGWKSLEDATLCVPEELLETYQSTRPWSDFGTMWSLENMPVEYATEEGLVYTLHTKTREASLRKYNGEASEVAIPEIVAYEGEEYKVTSLGKRSFRNCYSLTSIEIPSSVTSLMDYCFDGCSSLTSIEIPASVTSVGEGCFNGCYSLETIVVDAANPVYDSREGCNAIIETETNTMIAGCKNTRIPSSVTSLGNSCFKNCNALTSIEIPSSVTSFGGECFSGCSSLTSIEIPSSVTSLRDRCFADCWSLNIVICKMGNAIEDGTIFGWKSLEDAALYVPEELFETYQSTDPWSRFGTIRSLEDIPVEYVTDDGFVYNLHTKTQEASLMKYNGEASEVAIPATVTYEGEEYKVTRLGQECFANSSITSIEIPSSVTRLGNDCFQGCWSLKTVICKMENAIEKSIFGWMSLEDRALYVPEELLETYQSTDPWSRFGTIRTLEEIPVEYMTEDGFVYSLNMKTQEASLNKYTKYASEVIIPEYVTYEGKDYKVTSLGEECFKWCSSLASIEIPSSVTSLGDGCFNGCESLISIDIPLSVTSLGDACFFYCSSLASIDIPSSVTSFGAYCFDGCYSLTSIDIPSSVTSLGEGCFVYCSSLTSIEIPSSVTNLGMSCFAGCQSLNTVICKMENAIEDESIFGWSSLGNASLYVPEELLETYQSTNPWSRFGTIRSLEDIPVEYVTDDGFVYNLHTKTQEASLMKYRGETAKVVIPETVTYEGMEYTVTNLGRECFAGSSLASIDIPSSVTSLSEYCFSNCWSLKTVICRTENAIENGTIFGWRSLEDAALYVPEELFDAYQSTSPWSDFGTIRSLEEIPVEYTTEDGFTYGLNMKTQEALLARYNGEATEVVIPETVIYEGNEYKVTSLGEGSFVGCYSLASVELPSSVTSLGNYCFGYCPSLASIELPSSVTSLGNYCFTWCSSLTSVELPSSVTSLGYACFSGCSSLASIEIPSSVTSLGAYCFEDCRSLENVICKMEKVIDDGSIFGWRNLGYSTLYVPEELLETYQSTSPWSDFGTILPLFDLPALAFYPGKELQMSDVLPECAAGKTYDWISSNPDVVTVDASGKATAVGLGEATITATISNGFGVIASCEAKVFMPDFGDSNANGTVNIADAVNTANYAVGIEVEDFCFEAADVNKDQRITLADASGTVTLLLEQPVEEAAPAQLEAPGRLSANVRDMLVVDDFAAVVGKGSSVSVSLDNTVGYVALQADVTVPEGMTLEAVKPGRRAAASHSLMTRRVDERTMRVALFSLNNAPFADGEEALLELVVKADNAQSGDIEIGNIIAADAKAREYALQSTGGHSSGTTGVGTADSEDVRISTAGKAIHVRNAEGREVAIYSVGGQLVARFTAASDHESRSVAAGVYVVAVGKETFTVIVK